VRFCAAASACRFRFGFLARSLFRRHPFTLSTLGLGSAAGDTICLFPLPFCLELSLLRRLFALSFCIDLGLPFCAAACRFVALALSFYLRSRRAASSVLCVAAQPQFGLPSSGHLWPPSLCRRCASIPTCAGQHPRPPATGFDQGNEFRASVSCVPGCQCCIRTRVGATNTTAIAAAIVP